LKDLGCGEHGQILLGLRRAVPTFAQLVRSGREKIRAKTKSPALDTEVTPAETSGHATTAAAELRALAR
jgi:hypothetical protein